jgi:prolipoprotein diacylglyceryltransferase
MFPVVSLEISVFLYPVTAFLAICFAVFLFWRAGRRELVESEILFDSTAIFFIGALFTGRIVDFLVRSDFFEWSLTRLVFFNAFGGFNLFGAFFGGLLALFLFLRTRRENFWFLLDLSAPALAMAVTLVTLGNFLFFAKSSGYAFLYFFVVFWLIKRLQRQKRHMGYFACLFIFLLCVYNLASSIFKSSGALEGLGSFMSVASSAALIVTTFLWYIQSRRKLKNDVKSFFGLVLLLFFKSFRLITNIREADNFAKTLIFSPLVLAKAIYFLIKLMVREIYLSILDFAIALGVKNARR